MYWPSPEDSEEASVEMRNRTIFNGGRRTLNAIPATMFEVEQMNDNDATVEQILHGVIKQEIGLCLKPNSEIYEIPAYTQVYENSPMKEQGIKYNVVTTDYLDVLRIVT